MAFLSLSKVRSRISVATFVVIFLPIMSLSTKADEGLKADLLACGVIKDNVARLTCVDVLIEKVSNLKNVTQDKQSYTPNTALIHENNLEKKEADFGRSRAVIKREEELRKPEPEKIAGFGVKAKLNEDGELQEITASIEKYNKNSRTKHYTFYLDNGQVWRSTDSRSFSIPTKPTMVVITKGSFGGYRLLAINEKGREGRPGRAKRIK